MVKPILLLPPALSGGKNDLSKEAKNEIQALTGHRPYRFVFQTLTI